MDSIHPPLPGTLFSVVPKFKTSASRVERLLRLRSHRPARTSTLTEVGSSRVGDAALDLVHP